MEADFVGSPALGVSDMAAGEGFALEDDFLGLGAAVAVLSALFFLSNQIFKGSGKLQQKILGIKQEV